jgi:hypothetical protein
VSSCCSVSWSPVYDPSTSLLQQCTHARDKAFKTCTPSTERCSSHMYAPRTKSFRAYPVEDIQSIAAVHNQAWCSSDNAKAHAHSFAACTLGAAEALQMYTNAVKGGCNCTKLQESRRHDKPALISSCPFYYGCHTTLTISTYFYY